MGSCSPLGLVSASEVARPALLTLAVREFRTLPNPVSSLWHATATLAIWHSKGQPRQPIHTKQFWDNKPELRPAGANPLRLSEESSWRKPNFAVLSGRGHLGVARLCFKVASCLRGHSEVQGENEVAREHCCQVLGTVGGVD